MNKSENNTDEQAVNFIHWKPAATFCILFFIFTIFLSFLWIGYENRLINAHYAYFFTSLVAAIIGIIYFLFKMSSRKEPSPEVFYNTFTLNFLVFPNFWLSFLISTLTESEELNLTDSWILLFIFIISLIATWTIASAVIQGSEKIINSNAKNSNEVQIECRKDIENYIYKHNIQLNFFHLILIAIILMRLLNILPEETKTAQYIFGIIGFSFLLSASSEILLIRKIYNIKLKDGFLDIRIKLLQKLNFPYPTIDQFIHCVSPLPKKSKKCKEERVGYNDCEHCKKITKS